ncbi:MAG TPA: hypothetical protein GX011_05835 [Clostridiales bacterium]|jgi:hypothetical protein|nr:hypothetical protein [Clostridiales bacterium]
MRKLLILPLVLLLLATTGCRNITQAREPEQEYLAAAMGFDRGEGDLLEVTLEVIVFSVGAAEDSIESRLFSGTGHTVKEAVGNLSGEVAKTIVFSHCALLVLGETLSAGQLDEVFRFCAAEPNISISALVAAAPHAGKLLSCQSISTPITGYDLTGVLQQKRRDWGVGLSNRLYEVESGRLNTECFALPFFTVIREGEESSYTLHGIRIYENDLPSLTLNLSESAFYSLLSGSFKSGSFYFESDGIVYQPEVRRYSSKVRAARGINRVEISIRLILEKERYSMTDNDTLKTALERAAARFYNSVAANCRTDIFNLGKRAGTKGAPGDFSDVSIRFDVRERPG